MSHLNILKQLVNSLISASLDFDEPKISHQKCNILWKVVFNFFLAFGNLMIESSCVFYILNTRWQYMYVFGINLEVVFYISVWQEYLQLSCMEQPAKPSTCYIWRWLFNVFIRFVKYQWKQESEKEKKYKVLTRVRLFAKSSFIYFWVIDQVWGQDGWILAKSFFACLWTEME